MDFLGLFVDCAWNPTPPNNLVFVIRNFVSMKFRDWTKKCSESLECHVVLGSGGDSQRVMHTVLKLCRRLLEGRSRYQIYLH